MNGVYTKLSGINAINDLITNLLDTGKIHLFANNMTPHIDSVIGDFTEATFTGYPAGGVAVATWPAPYWLPDDGNVHTTAVHQFQATDGVTPNIIYGYYVTDKNGALFYAAKLPVPFNMVDATSAIILEADVCFAISQS
jgi:hypothetical protein